MGQVSGQGSVHRGHDQGSQSGVTGEGSLVRVHWSEVKGHLSRVTGQRSQWSRVIR